MANIYSKRLNLLEQYELKRKQTEKEKNKAKSFRNTLIVISAMLLICVGLAYMYIDMLYRSKMDDLEDAQSQIVMSDAISDSILANSYNGKASEYKTRLTAIEKAIYCMDAMPKYEYLKEDFFERLEEVCGKDAKIKSFSIENEKVTLEMSVDSPEKVSEFVMRLEDSGIFTSIKYVGFTGSGSGGDSDGGDSQEATGSYNFDLDCTFIEVENSDG